MVGSYQWAGAGLEGLRPGLRGRLLPLLWARVLRVLLQLLLLLGLGSIWEVLTSLLRLRLCALCLCLHLLTLLRLRPLLLFGSPVLCTLLPQLRAAQCSIRLIHSQLI